VSGTEPTWIEFGDALVFHDILITQHGGALGVVSQALIESAVARPRHEYQYETQDLAVIAATYAHSLVKNHGFVDGNKRTALACALTFLELNGLPYQGDQAEAVVMVEGLASGNVDRDMFAAWIRKLT
jgi:death-on-curing protein